MAAGSEAGEVHVIHHTPKNPWCEGDERFRVERIRYVLGGSEWYDFDTVQDPDSQLVRVADLKNERFICDVVPDGSTVDAVASELKQILLDRELDLLAEVHNKAMM